MDDIVYKALKEFDFRKVHMAMTAIDWKWRHDDGERVPSIQTLFETASSLLTRVVAGEHGCLSTGGFTAFKEDDVTHLEFILEEWNSEE